MSKFTWNIDKDAERWNNGEFETIDDCVKDYIEYCRIENEAINKSIFIGEIEKCNIYIDGSTVIENLEESVYDEYGEYAEDWNPGGVKGLGIWKELDEQLTKVVVDWLTKHDEMPTFYKVVAIREVEQLKLEQQQGQTHES